MLSDSDICSFSITLIFNFLHISFICSFLISVITGIEKPFIFLLETPGNEQLRFHLCDADQRYFVLW